jgi:hypothetical protein
VPCIPKLMALASRFDGLFRTSQKWPAWRSCGVLPAGACEYF